MLSPIQSERRIHRVGGNTYELYIQGVGVYIALKRLLKFNNNSNLKLDKSLGYVFSKVFNCSIST